MMDKKKIKLYAFLDLHYCKSEDAVKTAKKIINGGAGIIQIRNNCLSDKVLLSLCDKIRKITLLKKVLFIVNDRPDICLLSGADGVHVGQDDASVDRIRNFLGKRKIIGISTHSLKQAETAQNSCVDYVSIGPVFKTGTKPNLVPLGMNTACKMVSVLSKPVVAIGGINQNNIHRFEGKGFSGIAVVSAILKSKNIEKTTKEFFNKTGKL